MIYISTGPGNGFVQPGKKPLSDPPLTQNYDAI